MENVSIIYTISFHLFCEICIFQKNLYIFFILTVILRIFSLIKNIIRKTIERFSAKTSRKFGVFCKYLR